MAREYKISFVLVTFIVNINIKLSKDECRDHCLPGNIIHIEDFVY